jgi:hypothetical protein
MRDVSRAAKVLISIEIERQESPLAETQWLQMTIITRNIEKGLLPPQKLSGARLAAIATVWNKLLEVPEKALYEHIMQPCV